MSDDQTFLDFSLPLEGGRRGKAKKAAPKRGRKPVRGGFDTDSDEDYIKGGSAHDDEFDSDEEVAGGSSRKDVLDGELDLLIGGASKKKGSKKAVPRGRSKTPPGRGRSKTPPGRGRSKTPKKTRKIRGGSDDNLLSGELDLGLFGGRKGNKSRSKTPPRQKSKTPKKPRALSAWNLYTQMCWRKYPALLKGLSTERRKEKFQHVQPRIAAMWREEVKGKYEKQLLEGRTAGVPCPNLSDLEGGRSPSRSPSRGRSPARKTVRGSRFGGGSYGIEDGAEEDCDDYEERFSGQQLGGGSKKRAGSKKRSGSKKRAGSKKRSGSKKRGSRY
jgi:hypothetical protein